MARRWVRPLFWLVALLLCGHRLAVWTSERWWFESLGQGETFTRLFVWRAGAFAVFGLIWLLVVGLHARLTWVNAERAQERQLLLGGLARPSTLDRGLRYLSNAVLWGGTFLAALAAANRFDLWVMALHGRSWGERDVQTGVDLAFYLFTFPAWNWAWNWIGVALALTFLGAISLYGATETIETGPRHISAPREVVLHLAVLAASLVLWLAFKLHLTNLGAPIGGGWTVEALFGPLDAQVAIPTRTLLAWASFGAALAVYLSAVRERFALALGLFFGWGLLVLFAPPLAVSTARSLGFDVPQERELAVLRHLEATRLAWDLEAPRENLGALPTTAFSEETLELEAQSTANSPSPTGNLLEKQTLWPSEAARAAFESQNGRAIGPLHLERGVGGFEFRTVVADASLSKPLKVEVRGADASQLGPLKIARTATLDGVVLHEESSGFRAANLPDSAPASTSPPTSTSVLHAAQWREVFEPRFAVPRFDFLTCWALAIRFGSLELTRPGPPLTWHLAPLDRVRTLYPWINWNRARARPLVRESGRGKQLYFLVDGALTSRFYPHSAPLPASDSWRGLTYARANVVALLNATTGTSTLYLLDENEPLARAWRAAFPTAFADAKMMPREFVENLEPSHAMLDALALISTRYAPSPAPPDVQARDWIGRKSTRRPLWEEWSTESQWRAVTISENGGEKTAWLCAFAPNAANTANSFTPQNLNALALVLDSGNSLLEGGGRLRPNWFFSAKTLALPVEAQDALPASDERFLRARVPPEVRDEDKFPRLTLWPRLQNRKIQALYFVAADARRSTVPETEKENSKKPKADAAETRWELSGKFGSTEPFFSSETGPNSNAQLLNQLRFLWRELIQARRAGNWNEVERLEKALNLALLAKENARQP